MELIVDNDQSKQIHYAGKRNMPDHVDIWYVYIFRWYIKGQRLIKSVSCQICTRYGCTVFFLYSLCLHYQHMVITAVNLPIVYTYINYALIYMWSWGLSLRSVGTFSHQVNESIHLGLVFKKYLFLLANFHTTTWNIKNCFLHTFTITIHLGRYLGIRILEGW